MAKKRNPFVYRLIDVDTYEPLGDYLKEEYAKRDIKHVSKKTGRKYKIVKVYVNADGSPTKQGTSLHLVNPRQLLFRTRAAAQKYAREHGAKRFSIRKVKGGR